MKRIFFILTFVVLTVTAYPQGNIQIPRDQEALSTLYSLKQRQPNWRSEILKTNPNGTPESILLYEPLLEGGERPVKQLFFYETARVRTEVDVIAVDTDSPGAKAWNSNTVPHGSRIDLSSEGQLQHTAEYRYGLIHGTDRIFYPSGKVSIASQYVNGILDGITRAYFENEQLKEEVQYRNGQIDGDLIQYYENGTKAVQYPYQSGKIHGAVMEWYPSGVLKLQRLYRNGQLHGEGKKPAVIVYDERRNMIEVVDFRDGLPVGTHLRYHPNGRDAYRVAYRNGKKDGLEQFFDEAGNLLGSGSYQDGHPIGKHWRNYPDGKAAYLSEFDSQGTLLSPVAEFSPEGKKIREYFAKDEKLEGRYLEWHPEGTLKADYSYKAGGYDGEQKEYYPSGQMKTCTHYKDNKRDGLHEEWYENGVLSLRISFSEDIKEGQMGEWYPNGNRKSDTYFLTDKPDGVHTQWHENGEMKLRVEFDKGVKQGWQREWNEEEDLVFEGFLDKDRFDGVVLSYWGKDQIRSRIHYAAGKKEGKEEWFYTTGKPEKVLQYSNDLLNGQITHWFSDGTVQISNVYDQGKPVGQQTFHFPKKDGEEAVLAHLFQYDEQGKFHGVQKSYFPNGKPQTITNFEHGEMHGAKKVWDEQANLIEEANYVRGKLDGLFFQRAPDGREVTISYKDNFRNGPHAVFYPPNPKGEKIKALTATFENDLLQGVVCEYNELGTKIVESIYRDGKKEGLANVFTPDGKLSLTIEFAGDKKQGLQTQYFPNGAVFRETPYFHDQKSGEEKTYFDNGTLASVFVYSNDQLEGLAQSWNKEGVLVFEAEYQHGGRHGKFNKYYDDGKPYLEQMFAYDEPIGQKKKYDKQGKVTVSNAGPKDAAVNR